MMMEQIANRYEILSLIGQGGMADVYKAKDTILNRIVAIKVLRDKLSGDAMALVRFQREASAASRLSHPNVVDIYDVGEYEGMHYIVMEYIRGRTLKDLIAQRGALDVDEAIGIMKQLISAIDHAHDHNIIHRDIKPQNVLVKDDGTIKITDFGIAMALNSTQLTQTNSVMGSVHYLPPEQASGKGSTIRSDIYSMGILFYEILTGTLPFKGDNAVEIALKQMRDEIPSVRKKNPAIPQSVENVILKATAKNPKNRYSDAKEMHADLLTVLNDDRINEAKLVFKYPEHEVDENTKTISTIKTKTDQKLKNEDNEEVANIIEPDDKVIKKTNKVIWILGSIFALLAIILVSVFLILPYFTKIPDVKIPDVSNMTVIDAENELKKNGFEVELETVKEESEKIEKGKVIKTDPQAGRTIKKGSSITLYESLGKETYTVEDYTGSNYIEIQTLLKSVYGLEVTVEKKDVDTSKEYNEQEIVDQSVKAGTVLGKGDSITLYIPNILEGYPNMVEEEWTIDDVEAFCTKYNVTLKIDYKETSDYEEGTLISQSRSPKTPIVSGTTLKIVVAKKVEIVNDDPKPSNDPNSNTTETKSDTTTSSKES